MTSESKKKQGPEGMALPPPPDQSSEPWNSQGLEERTPKDIRGQSTGGSGNLGPVLQKLEPHPSGGDSPLIILASKDRGSLRHDNWLATKRRRTSKLWV